MPKLQYEKLTRQKVFDDIFKRMRCSKKRVYETKQLAVEARFRTENHTGVAMLTYLCDYCRKWHNGHDRTGYHEVPK